MKSCPAINVILKSALEGLGEELSAAALEKAALFGLSTASSECGLPLFEARRHSGRGGGERLFRPPLSRDPLISPEEREAAATAEANSGASPDCSPSEAGKGVSNGKSLAPPERVLKA
ncbi:MAG: hypothetical protein LBT40_10620 [Deltaproteobacteria bacterium]|jgi:hypothetical protein|nr:hypothetical protein [Deltaproteobacteria bacterium]